MIIHVWYYSSCPVNVNSSIYSIKLYTEYIKPYNSCHFFDLPVAWLYYLTTLRNTFSVTIKAYGVFVMVDLACLVFTILVLRTHTEYVYRFGGNWSIDNVCLLNLNNSQSSHISSVFILHCLAWASLVMPWSTQHALWCMLWNAGNAYLFSKESTSIKDSPSCRSWLNILAAVFREDLAL